MDEVLSKVAPQHKAIVEKLRSMVKTAVPKAEETVRRGSLTYVINGKNFAWIRNFQDHVDLGFEMGDRLSSPLLKAGRKGDNSRHVRVKTLKNMDEQEMVRLLIEAARLAQM